MVLKVPGEELDWSSNCVDILFDIMGHRSLVDVSSNRELLMEFCQLKENLFGSIGHRRSEVWNGLNDVFDGIFESLSCPNWCFSMHRGGSVDGYIIRKRNSGGWL